MIRKIVHIDEDKCDGCGLCVPNCAEGAIRIVDGKAHLVADRLCDGLGMCLGHCPRGAITIEERQAEEFDEAAVEAHLHQAVPAAHHAGGCPGSRFAQFAPSFAAAIEEPGGPNESADPARPSALTHWPVQLRLLAPDAPVLRRARLLVAADCVPVAYADFHRDLLAGRAVVVACPKLDDPRGYVEKLAAIIRINDLQEIVVAHMEVPCCTGILHMVLQARELSGQNTPVEAVQIGVRGQILARRRIDSTNSIPSTACPSASTKGVA